MLLNKNIYILKPHPERMEEQKELETTFEEEYMGALEQLEKERYKNATILFSKALFALCDVIILVRLGKLPKNHGERFRLLQEYFPDAYLLVDRIFADYTDAYARPILKETSENIKHGIEQIIKTHDVSEKIKKIVG